MPHPTIILFSTLLLTTGLTSAAAIPTNPTVASSIIAATDGNIGDNHLHATHSDVSGFDGVSDVEFLQAYSSIPPDDPDDPVNPANNDHSIIGIIAWCDFQNDVAGTNYDCNDSETLSKIAKEHPELKNKRPTGPGKRGETPSAEVRVRGVDDTLCDPICADAEFEKQGDSSESDSDVELEVEALPTWPPHIPPHVSAEAVDEDNTEAEGRMCDPICA